VQESVRLTDDRFRRARESIRVQAAFCVRYPSIDKLVEAWTDDLSRGGMFLRTQRFLPVNAVIRCDFILPGGDDVVVIARVCWVRDDAEAAELGKPAGMGIEFLDMTGDNAARIERYLAERTGGPIVQAVTRGEAPIDLLIVDDDEPARRRMAEPFAARGDRVRQAADGLEALTSCLKAPPQLVISDVEMPRMDGWAFLRVVRARPSLSDTAFVFLTALVGEEDRLRGFQLGVDDWIVKPWSEEELLLRVDRLVSRPLRSATRSSLRGDLEQVALTSVLGFLELERKTGVLLVVGERVARVYVRDGRPLAIDVTGAAPDAPPRARMMDVFAWGKGQFEFASGDVSADDQLQATAQTLVMEYARKTDEGKGR
jgi:uncharacterized protein (TIGR02266 family)